MVAWTTVLTGFFLQWHTVVSALKGRSQYEYLYILTFRKNMPFYTITPSGVSVDIFLKMEQYIHTMSLQTWGTHNMPFTDVKFSCLISCAWIMFRSCGVTKCFNAFFFYLYLSLGGHIHRTDRDIEKLQNLYLEWHLNYMK